MTTKPKPIPMEQNYYASRIISAIPVFSPREQRAGIEVIIELTSEGEHKGRQIRFIQ